MFANRKTVLTLILLAATAAFSTASISTAYQGKTTKFVGTFYTDNSGMVTIHSDGTVTSIVADMFAFTEARDNRRSTPSQGIWHKVGNKTIKVTTIFFFSEQFGDNFDANGLIVKVTFLADYAKPVNGVSHGYRSREVVAEVFSADQNPVTDAPIAVVQLENGRGYRL